MTNTLSTPDTHFQTLSNPHNDGAFHLESGSVELIELHDEPAAGVFPSLLSVYQQRGYQRGYQQAVADIVTSLFAVTEDFVKLHGAVGAPHARHDVCHTRPAGG